MYKGMLKENVYEVGGTRVVDDTLDGVLHDLSLSLSAIYEKPLLLDEEELEQFKQELAEDGYAEVVVAYDEDTPISIYVEKCDEEECEE